MGKRLKRLQRLKQKLRGIFRKIFGRKQFRKAQFGSVQPRHQGQPHATIHRAVAEGRKAHAVSPVLPVAPLTHPAHPMGAPPAPPPPPPPKAPPTPSASPKASPASQSRGDLLSQIQAGKSLQPVQKSAVTQKPRPTRVEDQISEVLAKRRLAFGDPDDRTADNDSDSGWDAALSTPAAVQQPSTPPQSLPLVSAQDKRLVEPGPAMVSPLAASPAAPQAGVAPPPPPQSPPLPPKASPASQSRGDLLSQIQAGKTLKATPKPAAATPGAVIPARSDPGAAVQPKQGSAPAAKQSTVDLNAIAAKRAALRTREASAPGSPPAQAVVDPGGFAAAAVLQRNALKTAVVKPAQPVASATPAPGSPVMFQAHLKQRREEPQAASVGSKPLSELAAKLEHQKRRAEANPSTPPTKKTPKIQ